MRTFGNVLTFFLMLITVMTLFLIADGVASGVLFIIVSCFVNNVVALAVSKWVLFILFILELLFTVPAIIKCLDRGGR